MRQLSLVLTGLCTVVNALTVTSDPSGISGKSFDFVVVGGGTAGLAVASRLAEIPNLTILVVEAGPDAQNDSDINNPAQFIVAGSKYNWGYTTTPQSVGGVVEDLTQGKVLGGSSSINGMDWSRGTKFQYDSLEQLGNAGWNWTTMLQYMKKAERFHAPNANQTSLGATFIPQVHGFTGAINAGFPQPYLGTGSISFLFQSFMKIIPGISKNIDPDSGSPGGLRQWYYSLKPAPDSQTTPGGNIRSSSARGYIYPFENTPAKTGLTVLHGHQGTRILWDDSQNLATANGVEFIATPTTNTSVGAERFSVGVKKEVIVASGAVGSPHFLELSGIGDPKILQNAGIPTKVNLPSVGTNLQDQALNIFEYLISPSAPPEDTNLPNDPGTLAGGFLDISQVIPGQEGKNLGSVLLNTVKQRAAAIVRGGAFTNQAGLEKIFTLQAKEITSLNAPILEIQYAVAVLPGQNVSLSGVIAWGLLPQWRGTVHAKSSDPAAQPELNPNYFTSSFDLAIQLNAVKITRRIFATSPLADFATVEVAPGFSVLPQNATDDQILAFVKGNYNPTLHPLGSVSMLPREDGGAVDSELKVYGTQNVRVVDSSILPIQISAHPSATVYGIAEKAADMIKSTL